MSAIHHDVPNIPSQCPKDLRQRRHHGETPFSRSQATVQGAISSCLAWPQWGVKLAVCLISLGLVIGTGLSAEGLNRGRTAAQHEVLVSLAKLRLGNIAHRGSLPADRVELRSEEGNRNAFFARDPTDPKFPRWVAPRPSVTEVWPRPILEERWLWRKPDGKRKPKRRRALRFGPQLRIQLLGGADRCDILRWATRRFAEHAFAAVTAVSGDVEGDENAAPTIGTLEISVRNASYLEYPHLDMREDYAVTIDAGGIRLVAQENWGVLRGLETLTQLIFVSAHRPDQFLIHENRIKDKPAYKHRGLMIDTARSFIQKSTLLENLEAMAMNKMNVFHWHIVDDQSFPYLSKKFPQLATKSAYSGGRYIYTSEDIREIVEFARRRGIRVVPEFDTPDHTHSWGHAIPDIASWCTFGEQAYMGPLDPTNEATFTFLTELYAEVASLFPDAWIHLGMDEVSTDCWKLNATVAKFMRDSLIGDPDQLIVYYANRLSGIVENMPVKKQSLVWEDILDKDSPRYPLKLAKDTTVQVWITRDAKKLTDWRSHGYRLIRSEDWYLDHRGYGADWVRRYRFQLDPADLGGEACMWTEFQSDATVTQAIWPSVSAVAERLWSGDAATDPELAAPRMEEQNCRMQARGIRTGVSGGPSMCQTPVVVPKTSGHRRGDGEAFGEPGQELLVNLSSDRHNYCWLYKWTSLSLALGYLLLKVSCFAAPRQLPSVPFGSIWRYERALCAFLLLYCVAWLIIQWNGI